MTILDLKIAIADSQQKDAYEKLEFSLSLPHINASIELKGMADIYEFALRQSEGFKQYENLPKELRTVKDRFTKLADQIVTTINTSDYIHNIEGHLREFINSPHTIFLYDSPETHFLVNAYRTNPTLYEGAYQYLTGNLFATSNKSYFDGRLAAYEFAKKNSILTERQDAETFSLEKIRTDAQKFFKDSESGLKNYVDQVTQKYNTYAASIDEIKAEKETLFANWFNASSNSYSEFEQKAKDSIKELENLYQQKLKLEAPAAYWSNRADKLRKDGYKWLIILSLIIIFGISVLIWVLNRIADGTIDRIFDSSATAIKWSVVLITMISFIAYGIRVFSKLAFSAFHLVRDAEEREQLTYVYLALQKEKGIDQTERHLIMQSLFSRADSGLLRDEGGPTMPGHIVDQITKR